MRSKLLFLNLVISMLMLVRAGQVGAQGSTAVVADPAGGVDETSLKFLPSTATEITGAIEVFDVEIANPSGASPLLIDQIAVNFSGSSSASNLRATAKITGVNNPTFAGTDSILVFGIDPTFSISTSASSNGANILLGPTTEVFSSGITANGVADFLNVAAGDTVVLTLSVWSDAAVNLKDGVAFSADILNPTALSNSGFKLDNAGESIGTDNLSAHSSITAETAISLVSTLGDPGALGTAVNVPSTATSKGVAVPVFQFKITDGDDVPNTPNLRPTLIDGLTIPIALSGGMSPEDIAGASLAITSSLPSNIIQFSSTVGGDREINTAENPTLLTLNTVGNNLELRAGLDAREGISGAGTADDGIADLLELLDPGSITTDPDKSVVLTVEIWLNNSGLTNNSSATFDLQATNITLDTPGVNSDVISPSVDVADAVATIFIATNENSTLLDRGVVPNTLILPSSAIDLSTAFDVFDFSVVDGIGGDITKIDSLSIPVTFSGGAKFSDLEGARLTVETAAISFAFSGGSEISTTNNPALVSIDSLGTNLARINFKGQAQIDTTDSVADLIEIPQNGEVAFTLAVWVDTTDIAFGSVFSFDLQNQDISLTAQSSDGLAVGQDITNGMASLSVSRLEDHDAVGDAVTISSAFSGGSSSLGVYDFKIVDPADGLPTLIDFLQIPIQVEGGAKLTDIAEVQMMVGGLSISSNVLAGIDATISTVDGDGVDGGAVDPLELDLVNGRIEAGVRAGGLALDVIDVAWTGDLLSIPDGETAILTIFLAINQDGITDSSAFRFDIQDVHIDVDDQPGATNVFAGNQDVTDGVATLRAATLGEVSSVGDSVFVSTSQQTAPGVAIYDFQLIDPLDDKPTVVDGIFIPWVFTGAVLGDIGEVSISVTSSAAVSIPDDATIGNDDDGSIVSGTDTGVIALTAAGIEIGSDGTVGGGSATGNGDGNPGVLSLADGQSAVVTVSIYFTPGSPPLNGEQIILDLGTANVTVDTQPGASGGIAAGQSLNSGYLLVSSASTRVLDNETVGNAVTLVSNITSAPGTPVFDFTIQDLDATQGGSNNPTTIDGLTIPIALAGMQFADIGGARVLETGSLGGFDRGAGNADTNSDGVLETGSGDLGIELVELEGGQVELRLGGDASGVSSNSSNGSAELIAARDDTDDGDADNPLTMTVSIWLNTTGIDDHATMTFSLNSANFSQDALNDQIVQSQSVGSGMAVVSVTATKLIFAAPDNNILAVNARSDTMAVAAVDINDNVDVDFSQPISISTSQTSSGEFRQSGGSFLGAGANLSATPTNGLVTLFYRDSSIGTATLTATSSLLNPPSSDGTFVFTLIASSFSVNWTSPALGTTTTTDSVGTFHLLQYAITNNDPNLLVEFWADQDSSLGAITDDSRLLKIYNPDNATVLGNLRNPAGESFGPGADNAHATDIPVGVTNQYVSTRGLSAGIWYLYMVGADGDGVSAGGDTLSRSGALNVLHYPNVIAFGMRDTTSISSEQNFSRDSGGNTPDTSIDLLIYAEDHDSNDDIELYISKNANLAQSEVESDANTFLIGSAANWKINDVSDTLRIVSVNISDSLGTSAFHTKGNYYFYALIPDAVDNTVAAFARAENLLGAQQNLAAKHSPYLVFSEPPAAVVEHSVAAEPNLILGWNGSGAAGDQDIDDNANISLWFAPASVTPTTFSDTTTILTRIVSGLSEDPDGGSNDQYAWELTQYDGMLPAAGETVYVWALLDDGGGNPVYVSSPPITFSAYTPLLTLLNPPPGAATEIQENDTFRLFFNADFVSNTTTNGTLRYLVSSINTTDSADFTFDSGASSTFPGDYNAFWISGASELKEGIDRFFDWSPKNDGNNYSTEIVPLTDGNSTFYVYALINTTGGSINSPAGLVLSQAVGQIQVTGIGSTTQDPAVAASPNLSQVAEGDTIRVLLRGNTSNAQVQGVQLYVNIDTTEFAIVDQDLSSSGVQPFGFEASYFFNSVPTQVNQVNTVDSTYKLDLDKRSLIAPEDPTGLFIAHIDLVARVFSGSATISWNQDSVNDPNRIPVFFNSSGLLDVAFTNPLVTFISVSRGSITGTVPLQGDGRSSDSKVTTLWLRKPGNWVSISDTLFVNANDVASDTSYVNGIEVITSPESMEAVQLRTGADGSFTLTQVPAGSYELVAKSESYLAGYAEVSVVDGQAVTGIRPTRISTSEDPAQLQGGDLTGDNKIDAEDESALNLAYSSTTGSENFNSAADIDDDGSVLLSDLLILAANRRIPLLTGIEPIYKAVPGANEGTLLGLSGMPLELKSGEEFTLVLELESAEALGGYTLDLIFDPQAMEVVDWQNSLLESHAAVRVRRSQRPGQLALAEAVRGGRIVQVDRAELAQVNFRALRDLAQPALRVERAYIADGSNRMIDLATRTRRAQPEHFVLRQNVPNPFNPSTQITFDVPMDGVFVELNIYNLMGQRVRQLMRAEGVEAGRYTLNWDGRDDRGIQASSGIYFYTLSAGAHLQTRKMLMMK